MKTRIVRVGNSRGIRISKVLLRQSGLSDEVTIEAEGNHLIVRPVSQPREGWDDAFRNMALAGDDRWLDGALAATSRWDESEWQSGPSRKTAVREAFNSPFWPFVLSTTSVGQEGLDFHLFCRDIVHWNLPSNPVDLEQREGRINRRDGLAIRRAIAREWPLERLVQAGPGSSPNFWERVFSVVAEAPDIQRYKHGLYPHWVFEPRGGQVERIRRHLFFYTDSQDARRYEELKERLALYRLVFGQPRQQDLLERIQRTVRDEAGREVSYAALTRYMINLSPLGEEHAQVRAALEAQEIAASPDKLQQLLRDVEQIEAERAAELRPARDDLDRFKAMVRRHIESPYEDHGKLVTAIRVLTYLRDPYDAIMDQYVDLGLQDDVALIRAAARSLASGGPVGAKW